MKLSKQDQITINDFVREYVDLSKLSSKGVLWGVKTFEGKNGLVHEEAVHRICKTLSLKGVPFATEVPLKCGNILDVCCPTHVKKIIEVMHSESDDMMAKKVLKLPKSLQTEVLILHAGNVLDLSSAEIREGEYLL